MRISVTEAAKMMDVTPQFIRYGLRQGVLPIGSAVKFDGRYVYYISSDRVDKYRRGDDIEVSLQ